jgi:hypothetical protein
MTFNRNIKKNDRSNNMSELMSYRASQPLLILELENI